MTQRVFIDGVLTPNAKPADIRLAVAAGARVVVTDNGGVSVQITQAILDRHDANRADR